VKLKVKITSELKSCFSWTISCFVKWTTEWRLCSGLCLRATAFTGPITQKGTIIHGGSVKLILHLYDRIHMNWTHVKLFLSTVYCCHNNLQDFISKLQNSLRCHMSDVFISVTVPRTYF